MTKTFKELTNTDGSFDTEEGKLYAEACEYDMQLPKPVGYRLLIALPQPEEKYDNHKNVYLFKNDNNFVDVDIYIK